VRCTKCGCDSQELERECAKLREQLAAARDALVPHSMAQCDQCGIVYRPNFGCWQCRIAALNAEIATAKATITLVTGQLGCEQKMLADCRSLLDGFDIPTNGVEGIGKRQELTVSQRVKLLGDALATVKATALREAAAKREALDLMNSGRISDTVIWLRSEADRLEADGECEVSEPTLDEAIKMIRGWKKLNRFCDADRAVIDKVCYAAEQAEAELAEAVATNKHLKECNERLVVPGLSDKENAKLREQLATVKADNSELQKVNNLARTFGYGQGELDDDLSGCLSKSIKNLEQKLAAICSAKVFVLCRGTDEQLQPVGWTTKWELAKEWATANNGRYFPLDETLSPNHGDHKIRTGKKPKTKP